MDRRKLLTIGSAALLTTALGVKVAEVEIPHGFKYYQSGIENGFNIDILYRGFVATVSPQWAYLSARYKISFENEMRQTVDNYLKIGRENYRHNVHCKPQFKTLDDGQKFCIESNLLLFPDKEPTYTMNIHKIVKYNQSWKFHGFSLRISEPWKSGEPWYNV